SSESVEEIITPAEKFLKREEGLGTSAPPTKAVLAFPLILTKTLKAMFGSTDVTPGMAEISVMAASSKGRSGVFSGTAAGRFLSGFPGPPRERLSISASIRFEMLLPKTVI